ncbi:MAG: hypothetical protein KJ042_07025 [Deltaproteobacteria bacterium]|nr:hypothetical protein [Deltaproteobacteria bacterium]
MPAAVTPRLKPGKVYRTRDFARWSANPTRFAKRLVRQGKLEQLAHGLFARPRSSSFGPVPPDDASLMRGFLGSSHFLFSGPPYWNILGLGSTAMFAASLVYNEKRSGRFVLNRRTYLLRRVRFPAKPRPEWYAIDLMENADAAGVSLSILRQKLASAIRQRRLDPQLLARYAREYGAMRTQAIVESAVVQARETV